MDEYWKHYVVWKKQNTKGHMIPFMLNIPNRQGHSNREQTINYPNWEEELMKNDWGYRIPYSENVFELDRGDGCTT